MAVKSGVLQTCPHRSAEQSCKSEVANPSTAIKTLIKMLRVGTTGSQCWTQLITKLLEKQLGPSATVLNRLKSDSDQNFFVSLDEDMWGPPRLRSWTTVVQYLYLPLDQIMEHHNISNHLYADDTRLYISVTMWPQSHSPSDWIQQVHQLCPRFFSSSKQKRHKSLFLVPRTTT